MKAKFTEFSSITNWVTGEVGNYLFEAKLYDELSKFGIDGGRVVKFVMWDKDKVNNGLGYWSSCVINYDEEWVIKPTEEIMEEFDAAMQLLDNAPKRFS